jgi:hypothetical protein
VRFTAALRCKSCDREWFEWSSGQIERWADEGPVGYDTLTFAELAVTA